MRVQALGQRRLQHAGGGGRAGEQHTLNTGVAHQLHADLAALARQQLHSSPGHASLPQLLHRQRSNGGRGLGRFGQHRVACGQCSGHLSHKNRQRKIPGADAQHRAQRCVGAGVKVAAYLCGVVAQKVHRLTQFSHGVAPGLACFAHQQGHHAGCIGLQQIGRVLQQGGALCGGRHGPCRGKVSRRLQRSLHIGRAGVVHRAQHIAVVGGVAQGVDGTPCGG